MRIRDCNEVTAWNCPVGGSHAFALHDKVALFRGGYSKRDTYQLLQLGDDGSMHRLDAFRFIDESGKPLNETQAFSRGEFLYLLKGTRCYRFNVMSCTEHLAE